MRKATHPRPCEQQKLVLMFYFYLGVWGFFFFWHEACWVGKGPELGRGGGRGWRWSEHTVWKSQNTNKNSNAKAIQHLRESSWPQNQHKLLNMDPLTFAVFPQPETTISSLSQGAADRTLHAPTASPEAQGLSWTGVNHLQSISRKSNFFLLPTENYIEPLVNSPCLAWPTPTHPP